MAEDFSNSILGAIRYTEGLRNELKLVMVEDFSHSILGAVRYTEGLKK
jgi:hypothetical protein